MTDAIISPSRVPEPPNEAEWLVTGVAVRGKGHIDSGQPCQDWCAARTSADGRWVAAVACDGAGSAAKADEGARIVAEGLADSLIALAPKVDERDPGPWIRDEVYRALIELREQLRARGDIRDYDCTVVASLMGPTGGMIAHVGDGLALGASVRVHGDAPGEPVGLWDGLVVSPPENGEYANETMFVTQDDWYKHVRITPLSKDLDLLVLTTDGMMPFVVLNGWQPNSRFLDPAVTKLLRTLDPGERTRLLESWLGDPETLPATSDDKTLMLLLRRRLTDLAHRPIAPHIAAPIAPVPPPNTPPTPVPETPPPRTPDANPPPPEPSSASPAARAKGHLAWIALALSIFAMMMVADSALFAYRLCERQVAEQKAPPPRSAVAKPAVTPPEPPAPAAGEPADGKVTEPTAAEAAPKSAPKDEP